MLLLYQLILIPRGGGHLDTWNLLASGGLPYLKTYLQINTLKVYLLYVPSALVIFVNVQVTRFSKSDFKSLLIIYLKKVFP